MWFLKLLLAIYCLKGLVYILLLLDRKRIRALSRKVKTLERKLSVDIVLPMYNEEKMILKTINNLLDVCNPEFSIIVIDDGSTDQSYTIVRTNFGNHPRIITIHQPNSGKSSALNRAMSLSQSDIIICIDADTLVRPDIIDKILPYFQDEKVAAVSGYVKVGNKVNFLTDMQYFEYLTIQNYERSVLEDINGIIVVPGALGAFRRSAVEAVGGFVSDALAEDCDITLRMLCRNYVIRNSSEAKAFTEAPDTLKMFFKQRVRWTVGLIQGLLKHSKQLARQPNKALTYLVMPYTWLCRLILPFFIPLVDYFFLYSYFILSEHELLSYYVAWILMEILPGFLILIEKKEPMNPVKVIFLQRLFRHLTMVTYLHIFFRWLNGNLYGWGKIPRQGNVKLD